MMRQIVWVGLCVLLVASEVCATTYYVAITGNDTTGNGTAGNPWRNPQKCFSSGTPVTAGDTCEIGNGTYTASTSNGRVISILSTSPTGTVGNPITIKATNKLGVTFEIPNTWPGVDCAVVACPFSGIYISNRSYFVIDGIRFTRPGSYYPLSAAIAGVNFINASTGNIVRNSEFSNIGRTVCSESIYGIAGIFMQSPTNATIENNTFFTIGRRRNGESGCVTERFHHDHGIYLVEGTSVTIKNNLFYDVTRGFSVNLKAPTSGTKTFHVNIYNNTFSGDSPTTEPAGQIGLTNQLDDVQIKNNIFHDPEDGRFVWTVASGVSLTVPTGAGIIIQYNLSNSTRTNATIVKDQSLFSPITSSNNILNTSPGFTASASFDFTLTPGSAAIDAGTDLGLAYTGTAPDCGAFEWSAAATPWDGILSVVAGQFYMAKSFAVTLFPLGPVSGDIRSAPGGAVAVAMQVRCDNTADCTEVGYALHYLCALCASAGAELPVPLSDTGDSIEMWGGAGGVGLLTGAHGVNLTGAETHIDGSTFLTSATTPLYDLSQNSSTVLRWVVVIKTGAPENAQYCFKVKEQTGVSLNAHTPSGGLCVEAGSASANAGP